MHNPILTADGVKVIQDLYFNKKGGHMTTFNCVVILELRICPRIVGNLHC